MFLKKLPLSLIVLITFVGSGFFYAQTNVIQNPCPQGRPEHSNFICQYTLLKTLADSAKPTQIVILPSKLDPYMFCPRGEHNFICQCGPGPLDSLLRKNTIEKKRSHKNKRRSKK